MFRRGNTTNAGMGAIANLFRRQGGKKKSVLQQDDFKKARMIFTVDDVKTGDYGEE